MDIISDEVEDISESLKFSSPFKFLFSKLLKTRLKIVNEKRSELVLDHDIDYNNFINIAEVIISKGNTIVESSKGIITLEALRHIEKIRKNKYFHHYVNRLVSP